MPTTMHRELLGTAIDKLVGVANNSLSMRTEDAIRFYEDRTISDEAERRIAAIKLIAGTLGIKVPSVYGWGEMVPSLRQLQLERVTKGRLKADPSILSVAPVAKAVA